MADLDRRARRSRNSEMNRMIFILSACCGLRASELCGLRLADVRLDSREKPQIIVRAETAKNNRRRTIPLWRLSSLVEDFRQWKVFRTNLGATAEHPFLASQARNAAGRPLDRRNARHRFRTACRALGSERAGNLTIHDGRHTCASHLLAAGWPLANVRDMLGHANISTTSIYSHVVLDDETPRDPFAGE